jgi:hypothetical protein
MTILWEFDENILNKLALMGLRPGRLSAVPPGLNLERLALRQTKVLLCTAKMTKLINLIILPWERLRLRQANQWALLQMLCYLYRSISGAVWDPSFDFFFARAG